MNDATYQTLAPVTADSAKQQAESIVRASGTTFYWAMRFLPEEKRNAMFAVYAFCRIVDDIADEPNSIDIKRRELARWRAEIEQLYAEREHGVPRDPAAAALIQPIKRFGLRREDFLAVIDGMETDAAESLRLETRDDLLLYCDRVACAVGRLCCGIFEVGVEEGDALASSLGLALQLTNILRDLAEDAERNRLYLPSDILVAHGISETDPLNVVADPRLSDVAHEIGVLAEENFVLARRQLVACDATKVKPAVMMMEAYERILKRIKARGWDRVTEPTSLSRLEKLWVAFRYGIF